MKMVQTHGLELFPIGIGTWGFGGFSNIDPSNDDQKQIETIAYMLSKGMNYLVSNYFYAEGKTVELLKQALDLSGVRREDLFITQAVYTLRVENIAQARAEVETYMSKLGIDYLDSLQFDIKDYQVFGESECNEFLHKCLDSKLIKFVSFTNGNVEYLSKFYNEFKDRVFAHENCINFEIRENQDNGVIEFAEKNNIQNVIYQPIRRNRTALRNWPLLVELAEKYQKTQNQIIYNWHVSKGYLPISKFSEIKHVDECLAALDFQLEAADIARIDAFRPPNFVQPKIYYGNYGEGICNDQLSNVFDEEYDKQNPGSK